MNGSPLKRLPFVMLTTWLAVVLADPYRLLDPEPPLDLGCWTFGTTFWSELLAVGLVWSWSLPTWRSRALGSAASVALLGIAPRWLVDLFLRLDRTDDARRWAEVTTNCTNWWAPLVVGVALALLVRAFDPQGRPGRRDLQLFAALTVVTLAPSWLWLSWRTRDYDPGLLGSGALRLLLSPDSLCMTLTVSAICAALLDAAFSTRLDLRRLARGVGFTIVALGAMWLSAQRFEFSLPYVDREPLPLRSALAFGVALFVADRTWRRRRQV
jgi:hypothetical protein